MSEARGSVAGVVVAALVLGGAGQAASAARAAQPGIFQVLSGETGKKVVDTYERGEDGDEFGTSFSYQAVIGTVAGGFMVGAPGAGSGAGAVVVIDARGGNVFQTLAADAIDDDLGRFGQSIIHIGHIRNASSVHWVVGAPGDPNDSDAATHVATLSAQPSLYGAREVIDGEAGSMFGWQVVGFDTDAVDSFISNFAVGAPRTRKGKKTDVGAVYGFDAETGERLWTRQGSRKGELFGYWLASASDVDGDGLGEIVVGAPGNRARKPAGRVYLLSGASGQVLQRWEAPEDAVWFGFRAFYTDVDGDGVRELVASAPASDVDGLAEAGSVHVVSDNARLTQRFDGGGAGEWFGVALAVVDVGIDGTLDLQIGQLERHAKARKDFRGRVSALAFDSGKVITSVRGKRGGDYFGVIAYRRTIDVDQDGGLDRIVGTTRAPLAFVPE